MTHCADMTTMASSMAQQIMADQARIAQLQAQVAALTKERDAALKDVAKPKDTTPTAPTANITPPNTKPN